MCQQEDPDINVLKTLGCDIEKLTESLADNSKGVLLLNVSEANSNWNRMALEMSHKETAFILQAMEAGFTEKQAEFMWKFVSVKDPKTLQNYASLTSGKFDPKLP